MEQTKNEPTKENKAAPETGKPKKEREPLTEAQRLKRQKMIVLPAMVLVFIGAMWLIFAPSSGKEQPPGTDGYNTEMPDADKANRQIIGDKLKAYEHGEMEERLESRNRAIGQLNGVKAMVEQDRYCGDVLTQLAAVESAVKAVSREIMQDHLETCVVERIQAGDTEVVDEVMRLFKKFM